MLDEVSSSNKNPPALAAGECQLIGYSVDTIVKWETGIYSISSAAEETLKKAFGKDLFGETEVK